MTGDSDNTTGAENCVGPIGSPEEDTPVETDGPQEEDESRTTPEHVSARDEKIFSELSLIREMVETRLSRDRAKEEAFDRLYEELDSLKSNKAFEEYRPLFIDLVLLSDRIQAAKKDAESSEVQILASLQEEIVEILSRRDIQPVTQEHGPFDPAVQIAVGTEVVESPELDGRVLRVLRQGFTYRDTILRPQHVVVGRYSPEPSAAKPQQATADAAEDTE